MTTKISSRNTKVDQRREEGKIKENPGDNVSTQELDEDKKKEFRIAGKKGCLALLNQAPKEKKTRGEVQKTNLETLWRVRAQTVSSSFCLLLSSLRAGILATTTGEPYLYSPG